MVFQRLFKRVFFGKAPERVAAEALYETIVEQARAPMLYETLGVPDDFNGRFEALVLHVHLVLRCLTGNDQATRTAQSLFDTLFHDMDRTLRAIGVGDMSVGKKVKQMGAAFYGRVGAYEAALADGTPERVAAAIDKNLLGKENADPATASPEAAALARYVMEQAEGVAAQPLEDLLQGRVRFKTLEPAE
jgi:cytochrome b pre-mRNA-processing protein 3